MVYLQQPENCNHTECPGHVSCPPDTYGGMQCLCNCHTEKKAEIVLVSCVMCGNGFEKKDLDFVGRCDECFHKFMTMPEEDRPKLGVPFSPIYNGKDKYGF